MKLIKYLLITFLVIINIGYGDELFDELLRMAYSETAEDSNDDIFIMALTSFNDGIYYIARKNGEKFLRKYKRKDYKREMIIYMLSIVYYKNKDFRTLKKHFQKYHNEVSRSTSQKMFQLINNYLIRRWKYKEARRLRKKYSYLFAKPKPFKILNKKLKLFKPNVNIFKLKEEIYIGENELYVVKNKTRLHSVAKYLDMGYDEMKYANPDINPFNVRKGYVVFVPRRRLLPKIDFEVGTIYLNLGEKRLYYPVKDDDGKILVITVPVGIGTDDNKSPVGVFKISEKRKNPEWRVPKSIREENPDLPEVVPPGPNNPLGTRAMRLGRTTYLMHGTNKRFGIGMRVSHGCIRMYNKDVEKLFEVVKIGTKVVSTEQDYKYFVRSRKVYIEIHNLSKKQLKGLMKQLSKLGARIDPSLLRFLSRQYRATLVILK